MGVFADAMQDSGSVPADSGQQTSIPAQAPAGESSPSSTSATPGTGTAPSQPQQSPTAPRTPAQPGQGAVFGTGEQKQVDLRALQESRQHNKQLRERYGWLPEKAVPHLRDFYQAYTTNPVGTISSEVQGLLGNPQTRDQVVQVLQQLGFVLPQQQAYAGNGYGQDDDPEPQADYHLKDGTKFMSAQRLSEWRAWHERQSDRRFDEKLQPIQQYVTEAQRESVRQYAVQQANQFAERVFAEARTWPHFSEHQQAIAERYSEYQGRMNAEAALYRAYLAVMHETVLPSLSRSEREAVAGELQRATKATTPNPTRTTGQRQDRRPESFRDAAERVFGVKAS